MGILAAATSKLVTPSLLVWLLGTCLCPLLLALVAVVLRSRRVLHTRLEEAHSQLDELRTHDPLTGLVTRPEFEAAKARGPSCWPSCRWRLRVVAEGVETGASVTRWWPRAATSCRATCSPSP